MNLVIPTIFARNKKEFKERFEKLISVSKNLQIDFMDGKFVEAKSVSLSEIPNLKRYKNIFEAHLMTENPKRYLKKLEQKGFKKIIFHIESDENSEKLIKKIKKLKMSAWIAINPETKIEKIISFLKKVDGVLFMGVHPGKERQKFILGVYEKIRELRKMNNKVKIQVDGGVDEKVAEKLFSLEVNYVNSGSYISDAKNPKEKLRKLLGI